MCQFTSLLTEHFDSVSEERRTKLQDSFDLTDPSSIQEWFLCTSFSGPSDP